MRYGFGANFRVALAVKLRSLHTRSCPFANLPNCKADPFDEMVTPEEMDSFIWVRPKVPVEVAYSEWTRMKFLRHSEFARVCQRSRSH